MPNLIRCRGLLAPLLVVGLLGCGEDEPACLDIPLDFVEPVGPLAGPDALTAEDCNPITLEGVEVAGLWLEQAAVGFDFGSVVEYARACEGLTLLGTSEDATLFVSETEAGVFRRLEFQFGERTFVAATNVCRADPDGTLFGYEAFCRIDQGDEVCGPARAVTLSRFGRLEGEPDAEGLTALAEWQGAPDAPWPDGIETNVRVANGVAYVTRGPDGLRIVDVADPTQPRDLGHFPADDDFFNDIKLAFGPNQTTFALVASGRGVISIDVTDPSNPLEATVFSAPGMDFGMHTLFVETIGQTTFAYLADSATPILGIFDVSDPANPVEVGGFFVPGEFGIHDLFVEDGRAYLNASFGGMFVIDTQPDPSNPALIGQYVQPVTTFDHSNWVTEVAGRKISVHGDEGAGTHVQIVDVDPESPEFMRRIGRFEVENRASVHNIMAFGDRAYVAWYQNGVRVLDLSDPTAPRQIAHYNTWEPVPGESELFEGTLGIDVDLAAGLIYAADTERGLIILSIDV